MEQALHDRVTQVVEELDRVNPEHGRQREGMSPRPGLAAEGTDVVLKACQGMRRPCALGTVHGGSGPLAVVFQVAKADWPIQPRAGLVFGLSAPIMSHCRLPVHSILAFSGANGNSSVEVYSWTGRRHPCWYQTEVGPAIWAGPSVRTPVIQFRIAVRRSDHSSRQHLFGNIRTVIVVARHKEQPVVSVLPRYARTESPMILVLGNM